MAIENNNDIVVEYWPFKVHFCPINGKLVLASKMRYDKSRGGCYIPSNTFNKMVREAYAILRSRKSASTLPAEREKTIGVTQLSLVLV